MGIAAQTAAVAAEAEAEAGVNDPCPKSGGEWNSLRERMITGLVRPENLAWSHELDLLRSCQPDASYRTCLAPIWLTAEAMGTIDASTDTQITIDEKRAIKVSVADYYDENKLPFAKMLSLPEIYQSSGFTAAFLGKHPTYPASLDPAVDAMQKVNPGVRAVSYISRFSGLNLVVLSIPGDDYDQYLHFELEGDVGASAVLLLSIQKRDAKHQPISPPLLRVNNISLVARTDKDRDEDEDENELSGARTGFGREGKQHQGFDGSDVGATHLGNSMNNNHTIGGCISCHRTGGIAILPDPKGGIRALGTLGASVGPVGITAIDDALTTIHKLMRATANATAYGIDLTGYGPPMGPVLPDPGRDPKFIRGCGGQKLTDPQVAKISNAMNCASCHSGPEGVASVINYPFGNRDTRTVSLLKTMILTGHMPEHADEPKAPQYLEPELRSALYACLNAEYYGGFSDPGLGGASARGTFLQSLVAVSCTSVALHQKKPPAFVKPGVRIPASRSSGSIKD